MIANAMFYIGGVFMFFGVAGFLPSPPDVVDERNTRAFLCIFLFGAALLFCGWMLTPEN